MAIPRGKHHCVGVRTTRGSASPWALKRTSPNRSCAPRGASYGNPKHCNNQCMPELWQLLWLLLRTVQIRHPQEMRNESRNEREGISTNLAECALLGCLLAAHLGRLNLLCRGRKVHPHAVHEEGGLPLVGHLWVHHGAVLVALDVGTQALVRVGPADGADLVALHRPLRKAAEGLPNAGHENRHGDVDEGVAETGACAEVHWKIDQVVHAVKAHIVQHLPQQLPGQRVRQAPEHDRGAPLASGVPVGAIFDRRPLLRGMFATGCGGLLPGCRLHVVAIPEATIGHEHPWLVEHLLLHELVLLIDAGHGWRQPLHVEGPEVRGHVVDHPEVRLGDRLHHRRGGPKRRPPQGRGLLQGQPGRSTRGRKQAC
mmetsp:Transcript_28287/g.93901  ORF Transcript_28287/g.93901 Transcript_28287/m.93901 type:complete len:370 (+) Transcript_28287:314-1423(+)